MVGVALESWRAGCEAVVDKRVRDPLGTLVGFVVDGKGGVDCPPASSFAVAAGCWPLIHWAPREPRVQSDTELFLHPAGRRRDPGIIVDGKGGLDCPPASSFAVAAGCWPLVHWALEEPRVQSDTELCMRPARRRRDPGILVMLTGAVVDGAAVTSVSVLTGAAVEGVPMLAGAAVTSAVTGACVAGVLVERDERRW